MAAARDPVTGGRESDGCKGLSGNVDSFDELRGSILSRGEQSALIDEGVNGGGSDVDADEEQGR